MPVELALLTRAHAAGLAAIVEDADTLRFTRVPVPPPPGFAQTWIDRFDARRADGTGEAFAVLDGTTGAFLGVAFAPRIDRDAATAELGYVVTPAARGRGVATEALGKLAEWAFADVGLVRLELLVSVANEASKRVAARNRFVREGVLRSLHVKHGLREDTEIWSRLATDP